VPTLVLSGDLDSITSPEEGFTTALQFPSATFVSVHNQTHIVAMSTQAVHVPPASSDVTGCVAPLVLRFVETLKAGDTSCTRQVRPIRTVPAFSEHIGQLAPARALNGNAGDEFALKAASAVAETAGDVLARFFVNYSGSGVGLRGGTFSFQQSESGYDFQLEQVRLTADLAVSGAIRWDQSTGEIQAELSLDGPDLGRGNLKLAWNDREADAAVRISGVIAGRSVSAQRIAP
jgi:hypothetical protein